MVAYYDQEYQGWTIWSISKRDWKTSVKYIVLWQVWHSETSLYQFDLVVTQSDV